MSDTPASTVTPVLPANVQALLQGITVRQLMLLFTGGLWEYVDSGVWSNDLALANEVRLFISTGYTSFGALRSAFDQKLSEAHDKGSLHKENIDRMRAAPVSEDGKRPGRKAKSLEDKFTAMRK